MNEDGDDIILFPDGTCLFRHEATKAQLLGEHEVIPLGTDRYGDLLDEMGY